MEKSKINVQDQVLNVSRKEKIKVELGLVSGEKLRGYIQSFDGYSVLLKTEPGDKEVMVYKHAIATVVPEKPLPLGRKESKEEEE